MSNHPGSCMTLRENQTVKHCVIDLVWKNEFSSANFNTELQISYYD